MNREIYDLLGSPVLTVEIVEYLMELLEQSEQFKPVELFERLNEFYELWCEGTFIDAPPENLPQEKMRLLREQLPDQEKPLGIRQIDVYAGLNVMILLLELHRYARTRDEPKEEIVFYPSGQLSEEGDELRLLNVISYSNCLSWAGFARIVGIFLPYANLSHINLIGIVLAGANLTSTDLTSATLIGVNLTGADLTSSILDSTDLAAANLTHANLPNSRLTNVNLFRAKLVKANLTNAHLYSAVLISADLTNADLRGADFSNADLSNANLSNTNIADADLDSVIWDEETNWEQAEGLETARNVPIALKQQLGLE